VYVAVRMSKRRCPGVTVRGRASTAAHGVQFVVGEWMDGWGGESSSSSESSLESSTSGGGVSPGCLGSKSMYVVWSTGGEVFCAAG
jgi:hypothetical protein